MNSSLKAILKIGLPLALGIALVWYSLSKISLSVLWGYFSTAKLSWIFLGVGFGILSHLSRAYRWKYMIEPMGYTLRLPNSIMAVYTTYLVNYALPRAGEVSRATIIANYEGIPFEKGFGTIIAERVADLLAMIIIICAALVLEFEVIYDALFSNISFAKIALIGAVVTVIILLIYYVLTLFKIRVFTTIKKFVDGIIEGVMSIFRMKQKSAFIAHTIFIWVMYLLMFYVPVFSLEATQNLPLAAVLIGFIFASFSIAATNGGIGAYPLAVMAAFTIFNIPEAPSIAFGWIIWTSQTIMLIILGGLSMLFLPLYNRWYPKEVLKQSPQKL